MELTIKAPLNGVSFGNITFNLLKECFKRNWNINYIPIGKVQLDSFGYLSEEFKNFLNTSVTNGVINLKCETQELRLWHLVTPDENGSLKGSYDKIGNNSSLLSFYELDNPQPAELNVAKENDTIFTTHYTCDIFAQNGVKTRFCPLGFDSDTYYPTNKKYFGDDRITFAIAGKFEHRKRHDKIIKTWVKRFGNDRRYYLQCATFNPFFNPPQINQQLIAQAVEGKQVWNINVLPWMPTNASYNDFLNSNNIIIGASGAEGWDLPVFQSVGIGKHAVIMNAHAYKEWANESNSVLFNPLNKIEAYDNAFFRKGQPYNQGNIFDFDADELIYGMEQAIVRYQSNPINKEGLKIKDNFTWGKTLDTLIEK